MADKKSEPRGIPPTRPFPSQIMHLLELTKLSLESAAFVIHISANSLENWMTFNSHDAMPPAQWLLLNTYTLAVKGVCWPDAVEDYVRVRFPDAISMDIKPLRKAVVPERPPAPSADDIIDMLHDAGGTLEEIAFVTRKMVNSWLGPDNRPMPYAIYELAVMTLWARGSYTPTSEMVEYIHKKYNGMFAPTR